MNILFLSGRFPQLSQTFVLNHIDYAIRQGHRVSIFAVVKVAGVDNRVVTRHHLYRRLRYDVPLDLPMLWRFFSGCVLHPLRAGAVVVRLLRRQIGIREALAAMQFHAAPEVMLANFGPNGVLAARLKQYFFPGSRLAVIFHGYDLTSHTQAHGWENYRAVAPLIDHALCVSAALAERLRDNTPIRPTVHYLGIPLRDLPAHVGHSDTAFHILFVGRLTEKKGAEYLLRAVSRLVADRRALHLHLIGDGPLLAPLQQLAGELGLREAVSFHGAQPHDVVLRAMSRADCLVAPSVTAANGDTEGLPVTIMEAMAIGLPVVSTRHAGIPELIDDGVSGLLTEERDVDGLAAAIAGLADDGARRVGLARAARETVAARFDAEQQDARLFATLATPGPAP